MKLKNIIISLVALLVLSACTDERLIEEVAQTGTFSIHLFMGEMEVKAGAKTGDNVSVATSDERYINNCFIAVFSKKSSEDNWSNLVWKTISTSTDLARLDNGSYQIYHLKFPIKTPLKIVVIANPPVELTAEDGKYSSIDSYSSLLSLTTVYADELGGGEGAGRYYTFNPKTLIKFGEKDVIFEAASSTDAIELELTQLAAKIHLNLTAQEKESGLDKKDDCYTFAFGEYSVEEILNLLNKKVEIKKTSESNPCYITVKEGQLEYVTTKPADFVVSAYYDKEQQSIQLSGGKICKLSYEPSYLFKVTNTEIDNIATSSYLCNPAGGALSNALESVSSSNVKSTNFSFYSYSKPSYGKKEEDKALKVTLAGNMADGYAVTKTEYSYKSAQLSWSEDAGFSKGGFVTESDITGLADSGESIAGEPEFVSENSDTNSYTIVINPSEGVGNTGVQHGNYYEVAGVLRDGITGLNITVKKWDSKEVNVSYGK